MTKHSPGPWKWKRNQYDEDAPVSGMSTVGYPALLDAERKSIVAVDPGSRDSGDDGRSFQGSSLWLTPADARLIAAAPEMLEALRAAATGPYSDGCPLCGGGDGTHSIEIVTREIEPDETGAYMETGRFPCRIGALLARIDGET